MLNGTLFFYLEKIFKKSYIIFFLIQLIVLDLCQINETITNKKLEIMRTLKNTTGSKAVNISTDATGNVRAMYVQIYNSEQQVLEAKTFANIKNAEKWAKKILN